MLFLPRSSRSVSNWIYASSYGIKKVQVFILCFWYDGIFWSNGCKTYLWVLLSHGMVSRLTTYNPHQKVFHKKIKTPKRYEVIPPYFCKYICPQGIIEGAIPLAIKSPSLRLALGNLFNLKLGILVATIILSILFYRPFCKWICPLGAFYSFFNKYSFYQMDVDKNKCIECGKCARVCKMDVDIRKNTGHLECIRCHECTKSCPTKAISSSFFIQRSKNEKSK